MSYCRTPDGRMLMRKDLLAKKIDCTTNQSALIEAYHASVSEDHLSFLLTGSCFGAYRYVQTVDDEGQPTGYQVQPKNQVVSISSDKTTNPNNRAKLVPRKITARNVIISSKFSVEFW